ncbi:MAG: abortive infection family protein [Gammaproteobacteria bacterium]|nr:abortive infection family protein [Gammaproteobacteria bacterium]
MDKIGDERALRDWLKSRKMEFACVLAARAALRVVPVLEVALCEDDKESRRSVILPSFRALAAANFAGAWPGHAAEVRKIARTAGQEAGAAIHDLAHGARMNVIEAQEAIPEMHEVIWRLERNARALEVAERAVSAVVEATHSVVAKVDAEHGMASQAAVFDTAVAVMQFAHSAIDGIHGDTELTDVFDDHESTPEVVPHIAEFWSAVGLDAQWLEERVTGQSLPEDSVAGLSEKALWLGGPPVWASRRWADFRDRLPAEEGWEAWIGWYEARFAGRKLDAKFESDLLKIASEDWRLGPAHVNAIIAELIESRTDPLLAAVARGFEDLEAVKQVSAVDLRQHSDRIRDALPKDPYQAIGATKDMLEATMKTILDRRGHGETDKLGFSQLTTRCLTELGLRGDAPPKTESERHVRKIASSAQRMIETANEFRNRAGAGHGRVAGKEPIVTAADAGLVASAGLILAAWMLHHDADG